MVNIPRGFPHESTVGDIEEVSRQIADVSSSANDMVRWGPWLMAGQTELLRRAIHDFREASDAASGRLIVASWALCGLTVVLIGLTIALIVEAA